MEESSISICKMICPHYGAIAYTMSPISGKVRSFVKACAMRKEECPYYLEMRLMGQERPELEYTA